MTTKNEWDSFIASKQRPNPEMETFVAAMAARHRNAVNEFGIPERIIVAEDVKLWRFTGRVDAVFRDESWSWPDVVPVFSGEEQIGAASVIPQGENLMASVTATYDLPERLDFEMGEVFTLIPQKSYLDEPGRIHLKALKLVKWPSSKDPISNWETL